jgi:hypothetical protein
MDAGACVNKYQLASIHILVLVSLSSAYAARMPVAGRGQLVSAGRGHKQAPASSVATVSFQFVDLGPHWQEKQLELQKVVAEAGGFDGMTTTGTEAFFFATPTRAARIEKALARDKMLSWVAITIDTPLSSELTLRKMDLEQKLQKELNPRQKLADEAEIRRLGLKLKRFTKHAPQGT